MAVSAPIIEALSDQWSRPGATFAFTPDSDAPKMAAERSRPRLHMHHSVNAVGSGVRRHAERQFGIDDRLLLDEGARTRLSFRRSVSPRLRSASLHIRCLPWLAPAKAAAACRRQDRHHRYHRAYPGFSRDRRGALPYAARCRRRSIGRRRCRARGKILPPLR